MNKLKTAVDILKNGGIIISPTDTVYGLLADATNDLAIKKLYELKQRPLTKPFLFLVSSIEMAKEIACFSDETERIANRFWNIEKKPLTIILKAKKVSRLSEARQETTIAIRLPNHKLLLDLINGLGNPIAAPSANISGMEPCRSYEAAVNTFGDKVPLIINGGTRGSIASTIVNLSIKPYKVAREGSVTKKELSI
ncbi:MAG: threonylcarbamoyl-AMP synthase [Holosporales bacterium]|nr:threonylcarbamoyl-AMP synthase [Holosporales bacterium]